MRRIVLTGGGLVISTAAVAILIATFDLGETLRLLSRTDWRWLAAAGGVITVQLILRTVRWQALLPPGAGGRPIRIRRLLPILLVGYLGNAVLPARLGEPVRAVLVHRRERIGLPEALGSVLLERIVDLAILAGIVLVAALAFGAPAWISRAAVVAALVGGGVVVFLALRGIAPLLAVATRHTATARRRALTSAMDVLERFTYAVGGAHRRRAIAIAASLSALAWLLEATTFLLVARSLGIDMASSSAMLIAGITVLGTAIPAAPGYVGTYDLAAAVAAQALGVPASLALAFALLVHVVTIGPIALGGALALSMQVRLSTLAAEAASSTPSTTSR